MKTYLSIDIDFWRYMDVYRFQEDMGGFFRTIVDYEKPIHIVDDHKELLDDINHRQLNRLINVDYHSDITNYIDRNTIPYDYHDCQVPGDLNCGTWVNFVKMRTEGEFIWIYPSKYCMESNEVGRCDEIEGFWKPGGEVYHNWKAIKAYQANRILGFDMCWGDIQAVGIALSSPWLSKQLEEHFLFHTYPLLRRHKAKSSKSFRRRLANVKSSSR